MPVSIFGINHKTAPVEVREKVAFSPDKMSESLTSLKQDVGLEEVAIISTCNRMEIIYRCENCHDESELAHSKSQQVAQWLIEHHQLRVDNINDFRYLHSGESAIHHIMSVACGLDSMVLGEPQILGQVKDAFGYANHAGTLGLYLNRLFQQTFSLAKQVRTDTQIGESAVSVAYAAVTLAKRIFADFRPIRALFIGAGETIELAARHLARQGVTQMDVANRTVERAQNLAGEFNGTAYGLSSLPELVENADIIISSTASPVPIIGKGLMEKAIKKRRHKPVFMVDLAVPRDIEPEVSDLNDVYLYTVDDMQDVIKENLKVREEAANEAKDIIAIHGQKYVGWLQSLSAVSLMKDFRSQFDQVKSDELSRSLAKLQANEDPEKVLTELANRLSNKFLHSPSKLIRQAGENNRQDVLEVIADAFSLKPDSFD
ncbi:MAG: glutamyl-tRNA reductase [Kangiellaceae bacterium]|nr:glutamyl-tRNA reductase [Kangiellaceae bacterium]MCW9000245.1 glutamyl-tRNA reductase [Kangiellaceae bacterium]